MTRILAFFGLGMLFGLQSEGQSGLVVNEVSQGASANRDWIELVVFSEDCSPVDIRHWIIDDNNGIFTDCPGDDNGAVANVGINQGHIRFTDDSLWSAVPSGTIILLYNFDPSSANNQADIGDLEDDYFDEDCDLLRVMPVNASNIYMEQNEDFPHPPTSSSCASGSLQCPNGGDGNPSYNGGSYVPLDNETFYAMPIGKIGFSVNADGCQTRTPDGEYFHGICWGDPPPINGCIDTSYLNGGPDSLYVSPIGNQGVTYILFNFQDEDFRAVENYAVRNTTIFSSPGRANSCVNADWIASLRAPVEYVGAEDCTMDTVTLLQCVGDTSNLYDVLNRMPCQDIEISHTLVSGAQSLDFVQITEGALLYEATQEGTATLEVQYSWSQDSLYSGLSCEEEPTVSRFTLFYVIDVISPNTEPLETSVLSTCGDQSDSAFFDLESLSAVVKPEADSVHYFLDDQGTNRITELETDGQIVYASFFIGQCQSPLRPLTLEVDPINRDTIGGPVCQDFVLDIGGIVFDQSNPRGSVLRSSALTGACDTVIVVDLEYTLFASFDTLTPRICEGDTFRVGASEYTVDFPAGVDTFFAAAFNGCDSIVTTMVDFIPPVRSEIFGTLCRGDILQVGIEIFDENRLQGMVTFPGITQDGCDSIVEVNLELEELPMIEFEGEICEGDTVVYYGTSYFFDNPSGRDTIAAMDGSCDTIVLVDLTPLSYATRDIDSILCFGDSLLVAGEIYDQGNPFGVEIIVGGAANGCDSIINVDLSFYDEARELIQMQLCANDSIFIHEEWYSADNPAGVQFIPFGSQDGCDSIIEVDLEIIDLGVFEFVSTICEGDSLLVGGTWYHMGNLSGTEVLVGGAANGCDSIVEVNLNLDSISVMDVVEDLCEGDTLIIGGTAYHANNLNGIEVLSSQSANGCDSIIRVDLTLFQRGELRVRDTLPWDSTREILGVVFDRTMRTGLLDAPVAAVNGCDSVILVDLYFDSLRFEAFEFSGDCAGDLGELFVESAEPYEWPVEISLSGEGREEKITTDVFPIEWTDLQPGMYTLRLVDALGFSGSYTFEILSPPDFNFVLPSELQVFLGDEVELMVSTDADIDSVSWSPSDSLSCSDCLSPSFLATADILYRVLAWDVNGCIYEAQIDVTVEVDDRVFVPNVFSPNGDNINDILAPLTSERIEEVISFEVFDRWGGKVFEMSDVNHNGDSGWDGTHKGETATPGVYVYSLSIRLADGSIARRVGDVTLVR